MYYVYVLRSRKDGNFYVGFTAGLDKRMQEHKNGEVMSTRMRRPLDLIYHEACISKTDATRREKYLKTAWGKRYIKSRLRDYLTG